MFFTPYITAPDIKSGDFLPWNLQLHFLLTLTFFLLTAADFSSWQHSATDLDATRVHPRRAHARYRP